MCRKGFQCAAVLATWQRFSGAAMWRELGAPLPWDKRQHPLTCAALQVGRDPRPVMRAAYECFKTGSDPQAILQARRVPMRGSRAGQALAWVTAPARGKGRGWVSKGFVTRGVWGWRWGKRGPHLLKCPRHAGANPSPPNAHSPAGRRQRQAGPRCLLRPALCGPLARGSRGRRSGAGCHHAGEAVLGLPSGSRRCCTALAAVGRMWHPLPSLYLMLPAEPFHAHSLPS